MSTHALIGFLLCWGCLARARGGIDVDSDRGAVKGRLQAMINTAMRSAGLVWAFFVDPEVCWTPPRLPCGPSPGHVRVKAGTMDLGAWETCRCRYRRAVAEELQRHHACNRGQVLVAVALEVFSDIVTVKGRRDLWWFALELMWCTGTAIEDGRMAHLRSGVCHLSTKASAHDQQKMMYRYFMVGRKVFGKPVCLRHSLGGGTLDKTLTTVGVIALPNNKAIVFPPQALSLRGAGVSRKCVVQTNKLVLQAVGGGFLDTFVSFRAYYGLFPRTTDSGSRAGLLSTRLFALEVRARWPPPPGPTDASPPE